MRCNGREAALFKWITGCCKEKESKCSWHLKRSKVAINHCNILYRKCGQWINHCHKWHIETKLTKKLGKDKVNMCIVLVIVDSRCWNAAELASFNDKRFDQIRRHGLDGNSSFVSTPHLVKRKVYHKCSFITNYYYSLMKITLIFFTQWILRFPVRFASHFSSIKNFWLAL